MWDIIAHLIHALIVFALSLVGVSIQSEAEAERQERRLDSVVSYDVPEAYTRACVARLAWSADAPGAVVWDAACLTAPAEPATASPAVRKGVPAFVAPDTLDS